ncbi:MerR family transcriptional regulator [Streptomyces sp. NPDC006627]|uniref:MerR family transcriptional regulator n=1 Tax=Streptomyces sp. NPDC006627 TaxID=3154679 RepID=UPI0033A23F2D
MAWSTREMAVLAGTSLRAVRHYHAIGLLDEPERRSNGYKQYGVSHLVRLLRIKRLAALGFSLSQIADMRDGPGSDPDPRDLRALDEELAAAIERLQHARAEVGALMRRTATADLPLRVASVDETAELVDPDRSFVAVLGTVLGPSGMDASRTCSMTSRSRWHANSTSFPPMRTSRRARVSLSVSYLTSEVSGSSIPG